MTKLRYIIYSLIILLVSACGTQATATPVPTVAPTPEEVEEAASAEVTPDLDDPLIALGKETFENFYEEVSFACSTCHYVNSDDRLLGPGLLSIEVRFDEYDIDEDDLEDYIEASIIDPKEFIVPDESPYPENIMPTTYGELFDEEELDALIAYILAFWCLPHIVNIESFESSEMHRHEAVASLWQMGYIYFANIVQLWA